MKTLNKSKQAKLIIGTIISCGILILGCNSTKTAEIAQPQIQQSLAPKPIVKETTPIKINPVIIDHGTRDKKIIALTFDADMTPYMLKKLQTKQVASLYDKNITDTLVETSTPATIFITGLWAKAYPEETKAISQNPLFEIANHSLTHGGFTKNCYTLGQVDDKNKEISETQKILENITGITPKYFRFPGGCYEKEDLKIVADAGLQSIQWDVISGDSFQKDSNKIISTVINLTTNGSIIVMHLNGAPNAPATAKALPSIIKELKKKGYTFVKLSDLLH